MPSQSAEACKKSTPEDPAVKKAQLLRLRRFGMAFSTYAIVTVATFLTTRLGLGEMSVAQWATFIGVGVFGNTVFFLLIYTNTNLHFSDPSLTREQMLYSAFWGMVPLYLLPEARSILLMFYLPAFSFGTLRLARRQFFIVVAAVMGTYALILVLEYIHKRQGFRIQYELFLLAIFGILLSWFAFFGGFASNLRQRLQTQNKKIQKAHEEIQIEIQERQRTQKEKDALIVALQDALNEVKTLSGLLPICSSCQKIRDDKGYWNQIESYILDHSEVEFSHGICPDCAKKLYPEFYRKREIKSDI